MHKKELPTCFVLDISLSYNAMTQGAAYDFTNQNFENVGQEGEKQDSSLPHRALALVIC